VLSALKRLTDDALIDGMTAIINIQDTHTANPVRKASPKNNIPFGSTSTLVNMEEPVVVKPDMDSNTQSTKLLKYPEK